MGENSVVIVNAGKPISISSLNQLIMFGELIGRTQLLNGIGDSLSSTAHYACSG